MGYQVAVMADSTSRWAEALREISGRLEELPAEEGFPAYLASRLGEFYERAARVETLNGREGSVSIIGAVSPPGGDFSEPVTMQTQRFTKCFWALDKDLAVARFFPSINPLQSYSDYRETIADWWRSTTGEDMFDLTSQAMILLREDYSLQQIVRLIGEKALPDLQQVKLLCGRLLKEGFLQQSAYDEKDMYASPQKQALLLKTILLFCSKSCEAVNVGIGADKIIMLPLVAELIRAKSEIDNDELDAFKEITTKIESTFTKLRA
jgi:V/A-type H+-transporting ATPase subunit A